MLEYAGPHPGRSRPVPGPSAPAARRPPVATVRHALDPSVPAEVGILAKRCGVPPAIVLLAGAEVLIARWSGRREVGVLTSPHDRSARTTGVGPPDVSGPLLLLRDYRPHESFLDLVVREAARPAPGAESGDIALSDRVAHSRHTHGVSRTAPPRLFFRTVDDACPPASAGVAADSPRPLAAECELSVDMSSAEVVIRYAEESSDAASVPLLAPYYGALLTAVVADPSTALSSIPFAPPAAVLRSPEALAELVQALPDLAGGRATGARIIDGPDCAVLPAGLTGALHLEVRDGAGADGTAWVDTGARGRFTPTGGILLERTAEPDRPMRTPTSYRRLGGASAAGMASQLAAVWAANLGLPAAEPGEGRPGLGDVLPS